MVIPLDLWRRAGTPKTRRSDAWKMRNAATAQLEKGGPDLVPRNSEAEVRLHADGRRVNGTFGERGGLAATQPEASSSVVTVCAATSESLPISQ